MEAAIIGNTSSRLGSPSASDVSSDIPQVSRRGPTGRFMEERAATNLKLLNLGLESTSLGHLLGWSNLRALRERWAWRERKGNGVTTDTCEFIMILVGTENPQGFRTLKGGHKPQSQGRAQSPTKSVKLKNMFLIVCSNFLDFRYDAKILYKINRTSHAWPLRLTHPKRYINTVRNAAPRNSL